MTVDEDLETGDDELDTEEEYNDQEDENDDDFTRKNPPISAEAYEDGEEDEDFSLEFDGNVDPLSLIEENPQGFEQFRKLEYEVVAARKRKQLLQGSSHGTPSQASKRAAVFGVDMEEIRDASELGRRGRRREPKKKGRKKGSKGGMTKTVVRKLGEANMFYVAEKYEEAIQVLLEIVKSSPNVPDSYHTLGLVHEALGNPKKAIQFYLLAAHLTPKDTAQWKRLSTWSKQEGNLRQAMYCATRAVRSDRTDYEARWERAFLFREMGDAPRCYAELERIHAEKPDDAELCHQLARAYHKMDQSDRAIRVLQTLLSRHLSSNADLTSVNILAELHMDRGSFQEALAAIEKARGLLLASEAPAGVPLSLPPSTSSSPSAATAAAVAAGQSLPLDLEVKAGICHTYLGDLERAHTCFLPLFSEAVEEYHDLLQDAGDALLAVDQPSEALRFFLRMQSSPVFDTPQCWIKVAQCHAAMKNDEDAIRLFEKVVSAIPFHTDSRIQLANIFANRREYSRAMAVLTPSREEVERPRVLRGDVLEGSGSSGRWWLSSKIRVKRAELEYSQGHMEAFLTESMGLVNETIQIERGNIEAMAAFRRRHPTWGKKTKDLAAIHEKALGKEGLFQDYEPPVPRNIAYLARKEKNPEGLEKRDADAAQSQQEISDEDIQPPKPVLSAFPGLLKSEKAFDLVVKTVKVLQELGRDEEAKKFASTAMEVSRGVKKAKRVKLKSLFGGHKEEVVDLILEELREKINENPYCNALWNAFFQRIGRIQETPSRYFRHMNATRSRNAKCVQPSLILGHLRTSSGFMQSAMKEYLMAYKEMPENAFVCLCCGTAMLALSSGSRIPNRNQCVLQAFAFLYKYAKLTNYSQEANYNLGRAYYQVGLPNLAVEYYKRVLSVKVHHDVPNCADDKHAEVTGCCDLQKECAHNLALIYKNSGAHNLARQVYKDFLTI